MKSKDLKKSFGPAFETGRYARLAERYCINRLEGVEGNEVIMAALIVSMAIREMSVDLCRELDGISDRLVTMDCSLSPGGIENALEELVKAVDGVADRV